MNFHINRLSVFLHRMYCTVHPAPRRSSSLLMLFALYLSNHAVYRVFIVTPLQYRFNRTDVMR